MLKGIFEWTTTCNHLSSAISSVELDNSRLSKTDSKSGAVAIIAFGNPLVEEDSAAIALIQELRQTCTGSEYCLFCFDSGFAWLKEVILRHDSVIILDSMLDCTDTEDGFMAVPLTREVIENSGFVIRATHGLSWLDELRISDICPPGTLAFFGIDGNKFKLADEDKRVALIERSRQGLTKVIEECAANIGDNLNA